MREIVIVLSDLYWPAEASLELPAELPAMPGLELLARFGRSARLEHGWREWLARWLGRPDLAGEAPASIAAAVPGVLRDAGQAPRSAWLATPVHLVAGLTSLHMDRRALLKLSPDDLEDLAHDFQDALGTSGFSLVPLPSGEPLMLGPAALAAVRTVDPARAVGLPLAQSLPEGEGAAVLRRLQAEMEMWLHGHPVNHARMRRGEVAVSALWPWGGGLLARDLQPSPESPQDVVLTSDAYARGLWHLHRGQILPLPDTLGDVLGYAPAQRAAIILEVGQMLQTHPGWMLMQALAEIDRRFIAQAADVLRRGSVASLAVVANGRLLTVLASDCRRWWRRKRPVVKGLLQ